MVDDVFLYKPETGMPYDEPKRFPFALEDLLITMMNFGLHQFPMIRVRMFPSSLGYARDSHLRGLFRVYGQQKEEKITYQQQNRRS